MTPAICGPLASGFLQRHGLPPRQAPARNMATARSLRGRSAIVSSHCKLAYFICDTVDALDLSAFHARYAAGRPCNQPFHPTMMVKVLLYAYATDVFSSRKIVRSCTRMSRSG